MAACREHISQSRRLLQVPVLEHKSWALLKESKQVLIVCESDQPESLKDVQRLLHQNGGWLGSYVPDNAVLGVATEQAVAAIREQGHVLMASSTPL